MLITRKIFLIVAFVLIGANATILFAANRYDTEIISSIADYLDLKSKLDVIGDGYYDNFTYGNQALNIVVENKCVTHIGYKFFTKEMRNVIKPISAANFIERTALASDLNLKRDVPADIQLAIDGVSFSHGSLKVLKTEVLGKPKMAFSINRLDNSYTASWTREGESKPICAMNFPASYETLYGTNMIENETRLPINIKNHIVIIDDSPNEVSSHQLSRTEVKGVFLKPGNSLFIPELNSNRYYKLEGDTAYVEIYDKAYPLESLANIFTAVTAERGLNVSIDFRIYGGKSHNFEVPLSQLLSYFISNGCTPYFGVDKSSNSTADVSLYMCNMAEGYCHLAKIKCNYSSIFSKGGDLSVRLFAYIPITLVKSILD